MENSKDDYYFVSKIVDHLSFIVQYMEKANREEFNRNALLQDSMMFRLIQISENARKLSDDYKEKHADVPWLAMYGLRNRIVHDYGNVDLTIVYDTLVSDIPGLLKTIWDKIDCAEEKDSNE